MGMIKGEWKEPLRGAEGALQGGTHASQAQWVTGKSGKNERKPRKLEDSGRKVLSLVGAARRRSL